MLSVDTNVLVRFLTADDAEQFASAEALIAQNDIHVTTTAMLETEWVLRSRYELTPAEIIEALSSLARLPRLTFERRDVVHKALDWARRGLELADALHLAASDSCEAFVSFDRQLLRRAHRLGLAAREP